MVAPSLFRSVPRLLVVLATMGGCGASIVSAAPPATSDTATDTGAGPDTAIDVPTEPDTDVPVKVTALRIIFDSPTMPERIDVEIRGEGMIFQGLEQRQSTGYLPVPGGVHDVVLKSSESGMKVVEYEVVVPENTHFTLLTVADWPPELHDDVSPVEPGSARVRLVHMDHARWAAGAFTAGVYLVDGDVASYLGDTGYYTWGSAPEYLTLNAGPVTLGLDFSGDGAHESICALDLSASQFVGEPVAHISVVAGESGQSRLIVYHGAQEAPIAEVDCAAP